MPRRFGADDANAALHEIVETRIAPRAVVVARCRVEDAPLPVRAHPGPGLVLDEPARKPADVLEHAHVRAQRAGRSAAFATAYPEEVVHAAEGAALIDGLLLIQDVNEEFGLALDEEEYHTIGGYVFGALAFAALLQVLKSDKAFREYIQDLEAKPSPTVGDVFEASPRERR